MTADKKMDDTPAWEFELTVPAETRWLSLIREVVTSGAGGAGLGQEDAEDLATAVDEACTNVIAHGYGDGAREGGVRLCCRAAKATLTVAIMDHADPFNPLEWATQSRAGAREVPSDHGRGIRLIRQLADETGYSWSEKDGNRLELTKRGE